MKSNTVWALITGLAVGFLIGQYTERGKAGGGGDTPRTVATVGNTQIPADWITEKDLKAEDKFAGLSAQQRYLALKVLNEKPCDCGCPHGNVAKCAKEDPGCPRAPKIIADAAQAAREGKSFDQIMAAVKKPDSPAAQAPAEGPKKVELAAWTPVRGPKTAKVTILEFSDFQ
jgi:hypothetical protein